MATTMMALRAHTRGGPEQLVYEPAPVPAPGPRPGRGAGRGARRRDAAAGAELSGSFDVIIDTVGGAALDAAYDLLAPGGRLVTNASA